MEDGTGNPKVNWNPRLMDELTSRKGTVGKSYNELLEEIALQDKERKRLVTQLDAVTAERDALRAALNYLAAGVEHSEASLLYQEVKSTEGIDPDTSFSMEYTYLQNALSHAKALLEGHNDKPGGAA